MTIDETSKDKQKAVVGDAPANASKGIVLYSDGGARAGLSGWGTHGYLFEDIVPKKGAGAADNLLTSVGYVIKGVSNVAPANVKPLWYIDGYGSNTTPASNNVAELNGAIHSLEKVKDLYSKYPEGEINKFTLYTDSKYVVLGLNEYVDQWVARNWITTTGKPVSNQDEWKKFMAIHKEVKAIIPDTTIAWVKGHGDSLGNNTADKLATTGVMYSITGIEKIDFTMSTPDGYWKKETNKHPFLCHKKIYFNTLESANIPGTYYIGDHGPTDEHHGKRMADTSTALVQLVEPDKTIECIREKFIQAANGKNTIVIIAADKLFSPDVYTSLMEHGHRIIPFYKKGMVAYSLAGVPLAEEIDPPRLAFRAADNMAKLSSVLTSYKDKEDGLTIVDITDVIYEEEIKKVKNKDVTAFKLKPQFVVGIRALPLKFKMATEKGSVELATTLTFGIDIPERNTLKHLESLSPKVSLIAWQEAPDAARYAVVIESLGSYSIWSGMYSNLIIITPDKYTQ